MDKLHHSVMAVNGQLCVVYGAKDRHGHIWTDRGNAPSGCVWIVPGTYRDED